MKTLHLPLKKKWYELIERGIKTEEYREIKPYWVKRLCPCTHECANGHWSQPERCIRTCKALYRHMNFFYEGRRIGPYTHVKFSYGYTKRTMVFEIKEIVVGKGFKEYGAPDEEVFIIKLGQRLTEVKLTIESPTGEKVTNTFFGESIT